MNVECPYLLLMSTTGIVDSVTTQRLLPTFLASYIFASPSASKFIAEQVTAHATYINQIPAQLLGMRYYYFLLCDLFSQANKSISRTTFT